MKKISSYYIFLFLIFMDLALSLPIACGNCVGKGDVCAFYQHACGDNLKCATLSTSSFASSYICLPTVEKGEYCDHHKDYDPCESPSFTCDRSGTKRCEATLFAGLNDDCANDRYCKAGMTCQSGKCRQLAPGACLSSDNCLWNEYCSGTSILGGTCRPRGGSFSNCNYTAVCKYGHSCILSSCIPHFSVEEGADCTTLEDCKPGLECYSEDKKTPTKCVKPSYHLLLGPSPTIAWGQECEPYSSIYSSIGGCKCDFGLHIYRFAKEEGKTFREFCKIRRNNLVTCIENNGCTSINAGADTCMRKYCYGQYRDALVDCAIDPSSVVFCAASNITFFVLMIILFVLLL